MEALVAQDGGDVLEAGDRVAELVAGQPVHGPGGRNGVDGLLALQPDGVEGRQVSSVTSCGMGPRCPCGSLGVTWAEVSGARAVNTASPSPIPVGRTGGATARPGLQRGMALRHERQDERLGRQVGQRGRGAVRGPGDHHGTSRVETVDGRLGHVGRRDPHELGQRLGRLLVGHAGRLGEAGLDRSRAQRGDRDAGAAQLGTEGARRRRARRPWTRRSRPVPAAAGTPRSTPC